MEVLDLQHFKLIRHIQKVQDLEKFAMEVVELEVEAEVMEEGQVHVEMDLEQEMAREAVESEVEVAILQMEMANIFRVIKKILRLECWNN